MEIHRLSIVATFAGGALIAGYGCRSSQSAPMPAPAMPTPQRVGGPPQNPPAEPPQGGDEAPAQQGGRGARGGGGGANGEPAPQAYNRVVTSQATSKAGIFTTHRIGTRLLYEIPPNKNGEGFPAGIAHCRNGVGRRIGRQSGGRAGGALGTA